jgi:RNA polymerase sigma factor (sigma-70 family)
MTARVAFEILYKEYYVRVFGLCRKLLNSPPLAEDATQETFMRAYRSFDKYNSEQPFWQWIASIANHHCIDVLRQGNKRPRFFGDEESELALLESADREAATILIDAENAEALAVAIDELPDKYRIPLVLAYFNERSYDEIAASLDISRNHVGVLLLRAKQQLRDSITDVDVEFQP